MTKTIALSRLSNPVKRKDLEGVIQFFQDRQVRVLVLCWNRMWMEKLVLTF